MFIGCLKVVINVQVLFCKVKDRDVKEVGEFEQVVDFWFCVVVFVGSNVVLVEFNMFVKFVLVEFYLFVQKMDIVV